MKRITMKWIKEWSVHEEDIKYFHSLGKKFWSPIKLCEKLKADGKLGLLNWLANLYCYDIEDLPEVDKFIRKPEIYY